MQVRKVTELETDLLVHVHFLAENDPLSARVSRRAMIKVCTSCWLVRSANICPACPRSERLSKLAPFTCARGDRTLESRVWPWRPEQQSASRGGAREDSGTSSLLGTMGGERVRWRLPPCLSCSRACSFGPSRLLVLRFRYCHGNL